MAQDIVKKNAAGVQQRHWIISVQVEGFGDSNDEDGGTKKKRKPAPISYNSSSSIVVLGFGGLGNAQTSFLTKEEQSKLEGI